jgi:hypothetical protein
VRTVMGMRLVNGAVHAARLQDRRPSGVKHG